MTPLIEQMPSERQNDVVSGGMIQGIDHIGIKVSGLPEICQALGSLGIPCQSIDKYDEVGLQIARSDVGKTKVELMEVINPQSPIAQDKPGLHHLALKTKNVEETYDKMKESDRYILLGNIRSGAHNRKIFFFRIKGSEEVLWECVESL